MQVCHWRFGWFVTLYSSGSCSARSDFVAPSYTIHSRFFVSIRTSGIIYILPLYLH